MLDAAARVLAARKRPMTPEELMQTMIRKGYWKSQAGKEPAHITLHAALVREIIRKGSDSRFMEPKRGEFTLVGK